MTTRDDHLIRRDDVLAALGLAAWKHEGDDAYSKGLDAGARQQSQADFDAIRALPAVTHRPMKDAPRDGWQPIALYTPEFGMVLGHANGMVRLVMWERGAWVQVGATIEAGWFEPTEWMGFTPPHPPEGGSDE